MKPHDLNVTTASTGGFTGERQQHNKKKQKKKN